MITMPIFFRALMEKSIFLVFGTFSTQSARSGFSSLQFPWAGDRSGQLLDCAR
jgi:hypothetical protein